MVARVKNPWAKKSKKGMKSLETIGKLAVGTAALAGTSIAHETKSERGIHQSESSNFWAISLTVMFIGAVTSASIGFGIVGGLGGFIEVNPESWTQLKGSNET